jgi:eukaryotic-like serine/threonine-protein kinase
MANPSSTELWRQADAILDQLMDLDPDLRVEALHRLTAPGPLRERVEHLLDVLDQPGLLDRRGFSGLEAAADIDLPDLSGRILGTYRLESLIGRGGMSAVYRARRVDGAYDSNVALKVLNAGLLATDWLEHFRLEVRFLASLRHPNIASLLDAGVAEDGTPWFVTEFVDGEPIDRYCRQRKLGLRDRVALMKDLCEAVAFAQRNLIVHRDIKPENVLVDNSNRVVLLDFGIARALDAEAGTRAGGHNTRAFTPQYAAPEQLQGKPVTTATDVFSLGVVLYRLLTDNAPFATSGQTDTRRSTVRPSRQVSTMEGLEAGERKRRAQALKGDLDNIVLKAMAEEPEQRYANAGQLTNDLQAWLGHRPVSARKPSIAYRLGLFVRRRVALAVSLATLLVVAVLGISATLWQAQQARMEAEAALASQARTDAVSDFMMTLFESADPDLSGRDDPPASRLLDRGALRIDQAFSDQPELRVELALVLAALYQKLGLNQQSVELLASNEVMESGTPLQQARAWLVLARNLYDSGTEMNQAADAATQGLAVLPDTAPVTLRIELVLARAGALHHAGQVQASLDASLEAKQLLDQAPSAPVDLRLAVMTSLIGSQSTAGDVEGALLVAEQAWELVQGGQSSPTRLFLLLSTYSSALHQANRFQESAEMQRQALALVEAHYLDAHHWRARILGNLGNRLVSLGEYEEAERMMRQALALHESEAGELTLRSAAVHNNLGNLLTYIERFDDGIEHLSAAASYAQRTLGSLDLRTMTVRANLAATLSKSGQGDLAEEMLFDVKAGRREVLGEDHPLLALSKSLLADHYLRYDQPALALDWVDRALANFDRADSAASTSAMLAHAHKGRALWQLGREVEARQSFDHAVGLAEQLGDDAGTNYLVVMDACLAFLSVNDPGAAKDLLERLQQSGELEKTPRRPEARRIMALVQQLSDPEG